MTKKLSNTSCSNQTRQFSSSNTMKTIIKTLRSLGFWSHSDSGYSPRRAIFFIFSVLLCLVMPGLGFIVRQEPTFANFMRNLIEILVFGNAIPQAAIVLIYRPLLERTYTEIKSTLLEVSSDPHRDVQTMLRNLEKFSEWIIKLFLVVVIFTAPPYFLSVPITITIKYIGTGVLPPLQGVFEADYLFFDIGSNFWLWLATCIVTLSVTLHFIFFLVVCHSFYWSLQIYVCGLFKIVSMKMVRLDEFSDCEMRQKEWVEIVQLQEVAYRCARNMEEVLNVFMLLLYGECILVLCMTLVTLTLSNDDRDILVKMITVSCYIMFHIFIYSLLGTELISASTATADAIYAGRWYERPIDEQRNVLFALGRSQKMAALTTGRFFQVGRPTFGMTLRTAFSYYTVLRQVYDSE